MRRPIPTDVASFLKLQIEGGSPQQIKRALQEICALYRCGHSFLPTHLQAIENTVSGLVLTRAGDVKIIRWALNAIAQFGRAQYSLPVVKHALQTFGDEPQVIASAVAALYKLAPDQIAGIKKDGNFDIDIVNLAILQASNSSKIDVSDTSIDIERSRPDILKLALVAVGLNHAPEHIFHPRHANSEIVRVLGRHDEPVVAQYSVWAVAENDGLSFRHLGIEIKDIEAKPPNVRGWVYRLVGTHPGELSDPIEFIELGCNDNEAEARSGLAMGLRDTYFDGLEAIATDWFYSEGDVEVRHYLTDHFVRNTEACPLYEANALEFYKAERSNSNLRIRMEAMAAGTPLYAKFKKIAAEESPSLLDLTVIKAERAEVVNNTFKTGDINVNQGAVALGGDATNTDSSTTVYTESVQAEVIELLTKALVAVNQSRMEGGIKAETEAAVDAARADPRPEKVGLAAKALDKFKTALRATGQSASDIDSILKLLIALAGVNLL